MENDVISSLTVTKIDNLRTLVIKQRGKRIFMANKDSIVIDIAGLDFILKFLVMKDLFNHKILERILDEYYNTRKNQP